MTTTQTPAPAEAFTTDPLMFGVGARITISVMSDSYVDVILGALNTASPHGLSLTTGDVSTWVGGHEQDVLRYLTDVTSAVAASGHHASVSVHLSRGCPGEVACALPGGAGPRAINAPKGRETGNWVAAEWALYPLGTGTPAALDEAGNPVEPAHMSAIYAAIAATQETGINRGSEHYVTRLEGDLGVVLEQVVAAWTAVGRSVQHVTSHLTLSINSPSHTANNATGNAAPEGAH
ncbi:YkoF family thiamine/hydroxymethylpyrimidine-binding protein [Jonesia quinghaiensis]|uniref:YkoF family thiamine/hydroxymethylpyrimidine-binding protein n=1 Tax=Jonesia quinghaiensis TaxID=262806 RepID=UPI000402403B|nr:YkoF family thiamine/hydroxymethylpyrimidine-binding protein [Jonesia quinghaiensis]